MSDVKCAACGWVYGEESLNRNGLCDSCQKEVDEAVGVGKPTKTFKPPEGWMRGEPVVISKRIKHNVVHLEVTKNVDTYRPTEELAHGAYCIYFRYWDEFSKWMKWWFE